MTCNTFIKTLFAICIFAGGFSLRAQDEVQKLKNQLKSAKEDTTKCYILNELVELTGDEEWPQFNQQLKTFAEKKLQSEQAGSLNYKTYKKYLAESINNVGFLAMYKGDVQGALKNYKQSLQIHEEIGNYTGIAVALNNIGAVYENQGNIIQALNYYDRSLKIKEKLKNDQGIANSLNNIGLIYSNLGDYANALNAFERSLKIEKKLKNDQGIATSYHNIGLIYSKQGKIKEAEQYYTNALVIFERLHDEQGRAYCYHNLGEILQKKKNYTQAMWYYNKTLEIRNKTNDKKGIAISLHALSQIYFFTGELGKSEEMALQSLKIARELGYPEIIRNASNQLYKIYKKKNNPAKALEMLEVFKKMNDSIYNIETQKASTRHQLNYEFQRKEEKLKLAQEKKDLIYSGKAKRQMIINFFSAGVILVIIIFSSILFKRFKISQKQREIISQKEVETQKQKGILEIKNKEITDSILYAKRIQSAILPADKYIRKILPNSFIIYKPKDIVAGDFYWFEQVDNYTFFAAADCTGHGVPGAMVSVVCHNALNRCIREFHLKNPGEILNMARSIINSEFAKSAEEVNDGMDISLGILDRDTNELLWAGANNPLWILRENSLLEFKPDKQPVGRFYSEKPFCTHTIPLQKGDTLYAFTDGYQDQFGGVNGKKFKARQLKELLLDAGEKSMFEQAELLSDTFEDWKGSLEQVDDVCIIGIRLNQDDITVNN